MIEDQIARLTGAVIRLAEALEKATPDEELPSENFISEEVKGNTAKNKTNSKPAQVEKEPEPLTLESVLDATQHFGIEFGTPATFSILKQFGARSAKQLAEEQWPDYIAALEEFKTANPNEG